MVDTCIHLYRRIIHPLQVTLIVLVLARLFSGIICHRLHDGRDTGNRQVSISQQKIKSKKKLTLWHPIHAWGTPHIAAHPSFPTCAYNSSCCPNYQLT